MMCTVGFAGVKDRGRQFRGQVRSVVKRWCIQDRGIKRYCKLRYYSSQETTLKVEDEVLLFQCRQKVSRFRAMRS